MRTVVVLVVGFYFGVLFWSVVTSLFAERVGSDCYEVVCRCDTAEEAHAVVSFMLAASSKVVTVAPPKSDCSERWN